MLLQINDLKTSYYNEREEIKAVDGVRLKIPAASVFAIVGESGCGKTSLGLSITNLIDIREGKITSGSVVFEGRNILKLDNKELRNIRGKKISYIFQEPATSLNPVFTIGEQISETLLAHRLCSKAEARKKALEAMEEARLEEVKRIFDSYPHQLSGGMKQRAMIAMAISTRPKLLIADEPTTALDVDTASDILELLLVLRRELSMSVLLITHDIGTVERIADEVAVMLKGKIVEAGRTDKVFNSPKDIYTKMLLDSIPERLKL